MGKISSYPAMTALQGPELILGDQSGSTATTTPTAVAAYMAGLTTTPVLASYARTAAEIAAGVTPTNYAYPSGNVKRYGAYGDGLHDDTAAIQTAIDVLNNWETYSTSLGNKGSAGVDFSNGGEVYLPGGIYLISNTIKLAPNIKLCGESPVREVNRVYSGSTLGQLVTILKASSSFPAGQYMVDSATYRRATETGTPVTPYRVLSASDIFHNASDTDNGYTNFQISQTVQDLQLDGGNYAAGGLRIQGSAFFHVDAVAIINTQYVGFSFCSCFEFSIGRVTAFAPAPLLLIGCESAMQDGGECQLYANASASWISANQTVINSYLYPYADYEGNWYDLTLKCIQTQWCVNVTFGYLSANLGNVVLEAYHSNVNILHLENEYTQNGSAGQGAVFLLRTGYVSCSGLSTKANCALCSGDPGDQLIVRDPHAVACPTSFAPINGETSSTCEVQIYNLRATDPILGTTTTLSTINLSRIFPYDQVLNLYVDASLGVATDAGLTSNKPSTLSGALTFIANNPHIREWAIMLPAGQSFTLATAFTIRDTTVSFSKSGTGTNPSISVTSVPTVYDAKVISSYIDWTSTQPQFFFVWGTAQFEIDSSGISIATNSVIFSAAANASSKVIANGYTPTIVFGSGSGVCSGGSNGYIVYEDSYASPAVTGTYALEAITTGKVYGIHTNL